MGLLEPGELPEPEGTAPFEAYEESVACAGAPAEPALLAAPPGELGAAPVAYGESEDPVP